MLVGRIDAKVGGRLGGSCKFGTDPCIGRRESAIAQSWPVSADGFIERGGSGDVHLVVDFINPFDVGTEAHLPGEVEGCMDAEPCSGGHRIHQSSKWRSAETIEVVALGEVATWNAFSWKVRDALQDVDRVQTACVD